MQQNKQQTRWQERSICLIAEVKVCVEGFVALCRQTGEYGAYRHTEVAGSRLEKKLAAMSQYTVLH